jgi:ribonuclease HII
MGVNPLDWDLGNVPPGIRWAGIDEAGRGAWAGPVVAAAVVLDPDTARKWGHVLRDMKDSKQVAPERREELARELKTVVPAWSVAEVDALAIDRENILEATLSAMRQAAQKLEVRPRLVLVDGNRHPDTGILERTVVDGDALSCAIACASLLAKTHRDARLRAMDDLFPGYGFAKHKGYGTAAHREALKALGACAIHRISFAPVARLQRIDEDLPHALKESLERCDSVLELQCWVDVHLRPAYGRMKLVWVETLRRRYAAKLAQFAYQEGLGPEEGGPP